MRIVIDKTTRMKLCLIGIPLLECLVVVAIALLVLFGETLFHKEPATGTDAENASGTYTETVVTLKARSTPKELFTVAVSKDGVLRYIPVQQEVRVGEALMRNTAQSINRPDIAALMDFSNGTLPILHRSEEAITLSKLLYGEARGIDSETEKAAIVWCVLNRIEDPRFPDTVDAVVTQFRQFDGYAADNPVQSNLYLLSLDVLNRWKQSQITGQASGRVLPEGYCYFMGDGEHNYFAEDLHFETPWDWSYPDPYPAIREERLKNYFPNEQEIAMIANVIYGASQGKNTAEKRAIVWCILNRVSSNLFPDTVYEVVTEKKQFPAYQQTNKILDDNVEIVRAVAAQWYAEQNGAAEDDVKRNLPEAYLYFDGNGWRNYFSKTYPVRYGYVFAGDRAFLRARW